MPTNHSTSASGDKSSPKKNGFNLAQYALASGLKNQPNSPALVILDSTAIEDGNYEGPNLAGKDQRLIATAYIHDQWTYKELDSAIRSVAALFRALDIKQGTPILLRLENGSGAIFAFFGAIAAGLIPTPISKTLTEKEVTFFVNDTSARWVVQSETLSLPKANAINIIKEIDILNAASRPPTPSPSMAYAYAYASTDHNDPAFLIYTSGTSAKPKGVVHAQRAILGRLPMQKGWHDIQANDRVLHAGDFNWTYTLGVGLLDPWLNRATALLYQGPKTPQIWPRLIANFSVTIFAAVPSLYRRILKYNPALNEDIAGLRHGLSAGETLSQTLLEKWQTVTQKPLCEALGQSEISTYLSTPPHATKPDGTIGQFQKGRRIAILPIAEGETPVPQGEMGVIAIHQSDKGLMLGYWQSGSLIEMKFRGKWFITGDLAASDENGYITHFGRSDELINASGFRVSPLEIESVILRHENVADVGVAAIEIDQDLSIIVAFVTTLRLQSGFKDELDAHIKNNLAVYKCPKAIKIVDELPRNQAGKLMRAKLKHLFQITI